MTPFHRASAQRGLVEAANTHAGPGGANDSITNMADAPNAVASPVAFGDRGGPDCTYACARMTMRRSVPSHFCIPCCVPRSTGDRASSFGRPLRAMGSTIGRRRARFAGARVLRHVRSHRERPDDVTLKPWAVPNDYPFNVRALSPEGQRSTVPVAPSSSDDRVWVGSLTPDREGEWKLTILNLQGADPPCYADEIITVEQTQQERGNPALTYAAIGLVVVGGLAGVVLLRRRRSLSS
jgi:hypothetical protein